MDRCPELGELEAFFGVAAVPAYGNEAGWYYDRLRFALGDDSSRVVCEVEPADRAFSVLHVESGRRVIDVSLQHVVSLDLESSAGTKTLVGRISYGGMEQLFKLRLSPLSFTLGSGL
jgi:hypothetical protein